MLAANLTGQVRNIAQVTTAVANGDLSQKITVEAMGEIMELKNTINTMVDQLSSFAAEVTRVAKEVGTEGKLGGQAAVNQTQSQIVITSTAIEQIGFPTGEVTADALYAGLATLSTNFVPVQYSDIDTDEDYPCILDIGIASLTQTTSYLQATVRNATAPFDIHADFTDLTKNPAMYDLFPVYSSHGDCPIDAISWDVPNETTVKWDIVTHPAYEKGDLVIMSFTVYNTESKMEYFTSRLLLRKDPNHWDGEL